MDNDHLDDRVERWQIGQFAELVGLSIPQLRRYDRLRLLEPDGRDTTSGYRYYTRGQTGAARAIALLRSLDMPIADIRRILAGTDDAERRELFRDHRARLEARLDEVRRLLAAVDTLTKEDTMHTEAPTGLTTWLHLMPRLPVTDMDRSIAYYQEALGFHLAWRTTDDRLAGLASGEIEMLLLVPWTGEAPPPAGSLVRQSRQGRFQASPPPYHRRRLQIPVLHRRAIGRRTSGVSVARARTKRHFARPASGHEGRSLIRPERGRSPCIRAAPVGTRGRRPARAARARFGTGGPERRASSPARR